MSIYQWAQLLVHKPCRLKNQQKARAMARASARAKAKAKARARAKAKAEAKARRPKKRKLVANPVTMAPGTGHRCLVTELATDRHRTREKGRAIMAQGSMGRAAAWTRSA